MNVLDEQWHFPGFVTSDWGATHSTVPSALAGLDMQMPGGTLFGADYYGAPLKKAVQDGQVPMSTLNDMVSRILTEMFRFGLFDHPPTGSLSATVTTPAHAQTGREVAESGTVLLKNSGDVLPLRPGQDKSVAVIGADAGQYALTSGGGSAGRDRAVRGHPAPGHHQARRRPRRQRELRAGRHPGAPGRWPRCRPRRSGPG